MTATRTDALPEHIAYQDEGCSASPTCLTCPLPVCKYDMGTRRHVLTSYVRALAIRKDHAATGAMITTLAQRHGCSVRTVNRALHDDIPPIPIPKVRNVHDQLRPSWLLSPVRFTA